MVTFGLVHGAYHGSWCWEKLAPELEDLGHQGDKTGGRYDSQIEQGEQKVGGFLGTGNQGGQDQQGGNQ